MRDIARYGITGIEIDGEVTDEAVAMANRWIADPHLAAPVIESNAAAAEAHLSYRAASDTYEQAFSDAGLPG